MIVARIIPEAVELLDEATERGIWIKLRGDELETYARSEDLSQAALDEFTTRLSEHREEVAAAIVLFGLAERNGVH
jgi:hypothetical protein